MSNEQMCLAAQVVEHASHFHGDVACSDKSHLLRPLFQVEETIRSYAQLASRSFRNVRVATGGQQNLFSADGLLAAVIEDNLSFVLRKEVSAAVKPFNVIISQVLSIYSIQTFDISIALVFESFPIERSGLLDGKTVCFGLMKGFCNGGSVPGDLLRYAT